MTAKRYTEEVIYNVPVKDVKVGDRIHQHGGGERMVIETQYLRYDRCPDGVLLVTVDSDDKVVKDHYPVISSQVGSGGVYRVPIIVTEFTDDK